ncbi:penicillin-binding protein [Arthrobacter sp. zg-Y40]|uniref:transglycosylase domain-containing protein n=1 Tax=unclassified Arthrobacter TaxID=235627 RepID=UPI001D14B144|nr:MULTISPECIES: transglycosylase domain-containing protein [unclassified Arthrobacter]MCC3275849.1 penicillin-binding protein [Arthrobacter sp. zg-Y20]MCC3278194.1 penicillin-binding protein [Arthrobacter sp. zg-Y40]MDK1316006.1 transglycosylase domain-containing protein [Arthrobacter sp. zg.Y20]WIB05698.1 transglycosylase domain-containing protein [Arthrobacter sp. zg-Y20]
MAARKSPFFDTATTLGKLVAFFGISALCGVLAAGLLVPAAAAAGTAASGSIQFFDQLPSELQRGALATPSKIYANDGSLIATLYDENRQPVTLDQVSPNMVNAVLAIEDDRYYEHGGVDLQGIISALVSNVTNDTTRGASTITQQYVNNVIIDTNRQNDKEVVFSGNKDYGDKLREMKLAIAVEKELSKDEILEGYFNIVPFSGTTYGVQAAARYFFNVDAKDLTIPQAALLAGVVNGTTYYSPEQNPERSLERRNLVLERMLETGRITQEEHDAAVATGLDLNVTPVSSNCVGAAQAPYFCDYVTRLITNDQAFGDTPEDREKLLQRGGLEIKTTLNATFQNAAQTAINETANPDSTDAEIGHSMVSVEPGTGKILVMAQNTRYTPELAPGNSVQNFNVDVYQDGDKSKYLNGLGGFQPGSTYKPFTVAAWLDSGRTLNTTLNGSKRTYPVGTRWNASCYEGGAYVSTDPWTPINYGDKNYKTTTVLDGLANSYNTITLAEAREIDLCKYQQMAFAAGVHNGKGEEGKEEMLSVDPPSTFGGGGDASPLSMATGFATFAAEGLMCKPIALESVTGADGTEYPVPEQSCSQVMRKEVAQGVNVATQRVMTNGSGLNLQVGVPTAGKTGTNDYRSQTWFMGYSTGMATASWIGNWKANNTTMSDKLIGGRVYPEIDGSLIAGPSWKNFIQRIAGQYTANPFTAPPASIMGGGQPKATVPAPPAAPAADKDTPAAPAPAAPAPGGDGTGNNGGGNGGGNDGGNNGNGNGGNPGGGGGGAGGNG